MWTEADPGRLDDEVTTREACAIVDVDRTTIWRWIIDGLPYRREPNHPFRYFYRITDLQAKKRDRAARRIAVRNLPPTLFDYN